MNFKQILGQHQSAVALTFNQFNIKAPVNEDTFLSALVLYKGAFINCLADNVDGPVSSYTQPTQQKGTVLKKVLTGVLAALGIGGAVAAGTGNTGGAAAVPPAPEKKKNWLPVLGIAAAVLLFISLMVAFKD